MKDKTKVLKYLAGELYTSSSVVLYDRIRKEYTPIQSSLVSEYLGSVNSFLFSGGVKADIVDLESNQKPQEYLNKLFEFNSFNSVLESLWYSTAICGETLILIRPFQNTYSFEYFEKEDYKLKISGKEIQKVDIQKSVYIDGKEYIYKIYVDKEKIVDYDLVERRRVHQAFDWNAIAKPKDHPYGFTPVTLIANSKVIGSARGICEFDYAAINLALECAKLERGFDESVEFFSNPIISSPTPRETTKELNKKNNVLQKLPEEDGGSIDLLQPQPLSDSTLLHLEKKRNNFLKIMGVSNPYELKVTQLSNAALYTLNFSLIRKAEDKWNQLVGEGLELLFSLTLKMAAIDNRVFINPSYLKDRTFVKLERVKPYFPMTTQEMSAALDVANKMFDLGLAPEYALQKTIFSNMSLENIKEMLDTNRLLS